ncbi:hypothetical protein [Stigmatella aurantiaca]|uniref:Conserved uncharacterized protein n=1 Tax=Stigmatella aurantiaca (strain DW4/3-1) TaxID=378806 RepID=E3FQH4_STIAD|nr:hypothetical protein [Stigmatella aurantiaca]ADO69479.1 conserved uncharacterized protein [Stigmatella aurantiaca DW4/3-1]
MLSSLVPLMLILLAQEPGSGAPTCRAIDSHVACGYACKSDGRTVQCAQTPQGRCQLVDGRAMCFDPPAYVVRAYGSALPEPECKTLEGESACGYNCATYFGKVKCARTPAGVCRGRGGEVECFDPPASVFAVLGRETPKAECRTQGMDFACGYRCLASSEGVKCATTPLGICKTESGRVTCFDPSPGAMCAYGRSLPAPQCRSNEGSAICGYSCATAFSRSACASTPKGICKVFDSQVYCFDPPSTLEAETTCLSLLGLAALEGAKP